MSTSTLTLEQVQRALARKAKQAERDEKRNAEIKVKYPFAQNVRSSTDEERLTLKKDLVADCKCECCDKMFVVAVQDLWHGKPSERYPDIEDTFGFCKPCRKESRKAGSKSKRPEDKMSLADLETELKRLESLAASKKVVKKSA